MSSRTPFSLRDGLAVQASHLQFWKKVLKPEFYLEVNRQVFAKNELLLESDDGYAVTRGTGIDEIVHNLFNSEVYKSNKPISGIGDDTQAIYGFTKE